MDLRIDANEAWSPAEVVERIRELAPVGLTSVEQPVAHENLSWPGGGAPAGAHPHHAG